MREPDPAPAAHHAAVALASRLGLSAGELTRGCARFHRLPFPDRDAFHRVVLEAASLDGTAQSLGTSASELARRARRGLCALLAGAPPGAPQRPEHEREDRR